MRRLLALLLISGCCVSVGADEPTPNIKIPMAPGVEPGPQPEPVSGAVDKLAADRLYVVTADVPLLILQSPDGGLVKITSVASPMNFFARFADGGADYESRSYTQPHIYVLTAAKTGVCELLLVPVGVKSAEAIVRQRLTVSGMGPNPPPGPDPPPDPDPHPQPVTKNVSMAIVEDVMNRSPDTAILMNGLVAWTQFVDSGNDWRAYDLKTSESRGKKAITDINGPVPGIVIYAKPGGQVIHRGALPATFDELKALIARLTRG